MKKKKIMGIALASFATLLLLAGCSTDKKESSSKEDKTESSVKKEEADPKKDAKIILSAFLAGEDNSQLETITGKSLDDYKELYINDRLKEDLPPYEDGNDWSITIDNEKLEPKEVLTNFYNRRFTWIKNIKDFEIKNVEKTDDTATVTFTSKGVALSAIANKGTIMLSQLFPGGLEEAREAMGSYNKDTNKATKILNMTLIDYFYKKFNTLEPLTDDEQDFKIVLTKNGDHYTLKEDDLVDFVKNIQVKEYSDSETKQMEDLGINSGE